MAAKPIAMEQVKQVLKLAQEGPKGATPNEWKEKVQNGNKSIFINSTENTV